MSATRSLFTLFYPERRGYWWKQLDLSNTGIFDNNSLVLESCLVRSEIGGKEHNMAAELPDVCSRIVYLEVGTVNSETCRGYLTIRAVL